MLGSYTSGPNGAFLAYLRGSAPMKDRVDWMAVDRSIAAGRDHYHDLWETGALPGAELADAIAAFHNLPRVRAEEIAVSGPSCSTGSRAASCARHGFSRSSTTAG